VEYKINRVRDGGHNRSFLIRSVASYRAALTPAARGVIICLYRDSIHLTLPPLAGC